MGRFILTFFCSVLSIGNLERISNENVAWPAKNNEIPTAVDRTFPTRDQSFEDVKKVTQSCLRHDSDEQIESPTVPPTRRSSFSHENQISPVGNFDSSDVLHPEGYRKGNKLQSITHKDTIHNSHLPNNDDRADESENKLAESLTKNNIITNISPLDDTILYESEIARTKEIKGQPVIKTGDTDSGEFVVSNDQFTNSQRQSSVPKNDPKCVGRNVNDDVIESPGDAVSKQIKVYRNGGLRRTNNLNGSTYANYDTRKQFARTPIDPAYPQVPESEPRPRDGLNNWFNGGSNLLNDPTKGDGISYINKDEQLRLMDYGRVCYACSSAHNPTCLTPDRRTTVKYCRRGVNSCVVKTFGSGRTLTLIRDCGLTCDDTETPGLGPKYKTCSICHNELCNGAYSISVHSAMLALPTISIIVLVKPLLNFV